MKPNVYVAGIGVISAIGHSVAETLASFRAERTGIGPITHLDTIHKATLPVGEVTLTNQKLQEILCVPPITRTALLGIHAAREAIRSSGIKNLTQYRTGLISATTVGSMDKTEQFFPTFISDLKGGRLRDVRDHECGSTTDRIGDALGITGFRSTINTACSSSVNAIMFGARMIAQGKLDIAVAGGTDALTMFTINGFNSLMILDKEPCRPFDATRSGLNLGEGAGFVVLVSDAVLKKENLESLCRVAGFANTNDAFHQTASSPEGRGSYHAMEGALKMANISPDEIDYINLHGTGTVNNDLSEGTAVKRMFGDRLPRMSSTKAFTGHTLGASGGLEAVFSVMALRHQCVFPNLRFHEPMPELGITPQQKFESKVGLHHVMSNSFGFGGNCSSILFST